MGKENFLDSAIALHQIKFAQPMVWGLEEELIQARREIELLKKELSDFRTQQVRQENRNLIVPLLVKLKQTFKSHIQPRRFDSWIVQGH